jgi:hypothetical protein
MAAGRERMAAERDQWDAQRAECTERSTVGPGRNVYNTVDSVRFCGGAKELHGFLDALCSNFNSHGHRCPRSRPDHVKYTISLLDACSNHQNSTRRQMAMSDRLAWAGDLSAEFNPCLQNFALCSPQLAKVYGDKDRRRVAVLTVMQGYIQLGQESVRAYMNRLKANWRQVGCNLQKHEEFLYDIA